MAVAAMTVALPLQGFTLAWTHSIEKVRWEEDYRIVGRHLELVEARIRGSGAGMEPPESAVLKNGVWHYRPSLPELPYLQLARSGYVADYELCWDAQCKPFRDIIGAPESGQVVNLFPCDAR